jgi:transcriptional regulator with XRE-family HTH domain
MSVPRYGDEPLLRLVLGEVLRRIRREQERTLSDVAERAQVSVPYLSEVERGRKEASSEVLAAICRALGLTMADLLGETQLELVAVSQVATVSPITSISSVSSISSGSGAVLLAA